MKLEPSKRKADPSVETLCEWARDNEPLLTFRSKEEIERIVRNTDDSFGPTASMWQAALVTFVATMVFAVIERFIGDLVMHREISRLARGTYGQLSHE